MKLIASDLAGNVDGTKGIAFGWFKRTASTGTFQRIYSSSGGSSMSCYLTSGGTFTLLNKDTDTSTNLTPWDSDTFITNLGTGGDLFTENGTLTDCPDSPSD